MSSSRPVGQLGQRAQVGNRPLRLTGDLHRLVREQRDDVLAVGAEVVFPSTGHQVHVELLHVVRLEVAELPDVIFAGDPDRDPVGTFSRAVCVPAKPCNALAVKYRDVLSVITSGVRG